MKEKVRDSVATDEEKIEKMKELITPKINI